MVRREPSQYDFENLVFDELLIPASWNRYTPGRPGKIEFVGIHHMTIPDTNDGGANVRCRDTWKKRKASAHYGVDNDEIAQFVWDRNTAWSLGNSYANGRSVNVEHANERLGGPWTLSKKTLATSVELVAWMHVVFELGRPRSNAEGTSGTIRKHSAYSATACPGDSFKGELWLAYVDRVARRYDEITSGEDMALSDSDIDKIVDAMKKDLFNADVVKIQDPVGTEESREKNPYWQVDSVLSTLLRELVETRDMVSELLASQGGGTPPKA